MPDPSDAIRELTEGDSLYQLLEAEAGKRRSGDDDLRGAAIGSHVVMVAILITLAAELGPEFAGNVKKVLANMDKRYGDKLRASLSPKAVQLLNSRIGSADKLLDALPNTASIRRLLIDGGGE